MCVPGSTLHVLDRNVVTLTACSVTVRGLVAP